MAIKEDFPNGSQNYATTVRCGPQYLEPKYCIADWFRQVSMKETSTGANKVQSHTCRHERGLNSDLFKGQSPISRQWKGNIINPITRTFTNNFSILKIKAIF